jgi:hypothetical protein
MLNDALLVDDEGRALCQFVTRGPDLLEAERHAIQLEHLAILIAQQRKSNVDLASECRVRCWAVVAYSEDYSVACFQLGPISLIGF